MLYPEYPVMGFLAAALVLLPLPRQIRARNIATIAMVFWFFQHCVVSAINAVVWAGNVNNPVPVWCDITTKLRDAATIALPAATLCITKHLELVSSIRPVELKGSQPRRRKIFEVVMCFGIPCIWIFVSYCFQTVRYIIAEDFGCYPEFIRSNVAVAIIFGPTLLLSVMTLVYGCIALHHLIRNHKSTAKILAQHLRSRDSCLSSQIQYYRLMSISMILGIWGIIWISLEIKYSTMYGSLPMPSWKRLHSDPSFVLIIPTIAMTPSLLRQYRVMWWAAPGAAYVFFFLFGANRDVFSEYQRLWVWFRTKVLRQPLPEKSLTLSSLRTGSYTIPIHIDTTVVGDLESKLPLDSPIKLAPLTISS